MKSGWPWLVTEEVQDYATKWHWHAVILAIYPCAFTVVAEMLESSLKSGFLGLVTHNKTLRPDSYQVTYQINNGKTQFELFFNRPGG